MAEPAAPPSEDEVMDALSNVIDPELEQFRWMMEELRVSLFAQELKTLFPVSVKRLEQQWMKVQS